MPGDAYCVRQKRIDAIMMVPRIMKRPLPANFPYIIDQRYYEILLYMCRILDSIVDEDYFPNYDDLTNG